MRGSVLVKIGIRAIILGVVVLLAGWYWEPTTVAVNQRVSLTRGKIEVPEFKVNNESAYDIGLIFDKPDLAQQPGCNGYVVSVFDHSHPLDTFTVFETGSQR